MPRPLPSIPARESLNLHKTLSAPALLRTIRQSFTDLTECRKGEVSCGLVDAVMSALAVFSLKFSSLLQFDKKREGYRIKHNLRNLYGILRVPCDTTMRELCDEVKPEELRPAFVGVIRQAQKEGVLEDFQYLGRHLLSMDGTSQFSSTKVHCPDCCEKHHHNGETEYYHQALVAAIVHPDKRNVLPLFPEGITKQDGKTKNDCESNAAKRLLPAIKEALPEMHFTVLADALSADGPQIRLIKKLGYSFIIRAKPDDLVYLFNEVKMRMNRGETEEFEEVGKDGIIRGYRWVNGVPLNKQNPDILVNYLDYWEVRNCQEKPHNFIWITDITLTRENVNAVMRAGRTRWKIENETLNTLKNSGYNFEHNYGHGKKHLATVFAHLMMLAFLVDQVQEQVCTLFKAARNRFYSRQALWERIRGVVQNFFVETWEDLWLGIIYDWGGGKWCADTS